MEEPGDGPEYWAGGEQPPGAVAAVMEPAAERVMMAEQPVANPERKTLRMFIATFYLAVVVTNFAWLYPILTGAAISPFMWNMEMWLPSWR